MTTPQPNRAEHELHWLPASQTFEIVVLHPMTPEAGCGWIGRATTEAEDDALWRHVAAHTDGIDTDDAAHHDTDDFDYFDRLLDEFNDAWSGEADIDGVEYRVSSDGEIMVVTHWCMFAQQHEWGVEEMVEGARWDGPDGASIPVAAITDFDYDEGPCVTRLGPLTPRSA